MRVVNFVTVITFGLFAFTANAGHCPLDAAAIDAGLSKAQLTEQAKVDVNKLKDEGIALHEQGLHDQAVEKLSASMRLLLLEMR